MGEGDPPAPVLSFANMDIRRLVEASQLVDRTAGDPIPDNHSVPAEEGSQPQSGAIPTGKDNDDTSAASHSHSVAAPCDPNETLASSTDQRATSDSATSEQQPGRPPSSSQPPAETSSTSLPPPVEDRNSRQSVDEPHHHREGSQIPDDDATAPPPSSSSGPAVAAGSSGDLGLPPRGSDSASLNASSFSVDLSIDTDSSDADSAMGSFRGQSSSMSATSSIFDFVEEHGRTWHRYKEGKYFMPNDITEQERLELQHSISLRLLGALYLAPIDRPHRVLDIGTGTGIWAIDFANEHPESDVLGTDLSPIQPEYVPPNCRFEVDDAEDEWVFSFPFDFIHSRYMSGSFSDFPAIFHMCYQNLNPGGWIEFQDYVVKLRAVDDSLRGTALERWNDLVIEGVRRMGKNANACLKYKTQMQEAGFVDVREEKMALPGNPWARGEEQKMLGTMQMENILDGLHGFSIGLFTKMMGMSTQEVELLLVDVRKDLRNTRIHFYYLVYSVYGRKPF